MLRAFVTSVLALAAVASAQDTVAPELRAAMQSVGPGARVPAYLVMRDQLGAAQLQEATRGLHGKALRAAVVALLKQHAAVSQAAVAQTLDLAVTQGRAAQVQPLWMGNAVLFEAQPQIIERLASLPGVDRMQRQSSPGLEAIHDGGPTGVTPAAAPKAPAGAIGLAAPEPNITGLQAPAVWAQGFNGSGVLIANIDTGTWITHPDLVKRVWNNPGEIPGNNIDDDGNGFKDDLHGWDFTNNTADVTSSDPHGTNTAGIICGDGSSTKLTGMAPGATMVVCQMSTEQNYWLAQQYSLLIGVDCITSSNSFKWAFVPKPDYHMNRQLCDVELAAGIIHSNSIGNQGQLLSSYPIPFNVATPGNCPAPFAHPNEVQHGRSAVMGCGALTMFGDALYADSGRGPAAWENVVLYSSSYPWTQNPAYWDYPKGGFSGTGPGLIKPDVMTYTDVNTTTLGTGYTIFGGTSAATPHLGGALCLMLDVQPQAAPRHIAAALELTAQDLGVPGKDNIYGAGKLRCFVAARRLLLLGRFDTQTPSPGETITLDLFGPANQVAYSFLSTAIVDDATEWNLKLPFLFTGVWALDASGHLAVPMTVPNDSALLGLTAWMQFGGHNHVAGWGNGPLISVPESVTISP